MQKNEKAKSFTKATLRIYWAHAKKYPKQLSILLIAPFFIAIFPLLRPLIYKNFIDTLSAGNTEKFNELFSSLLLMAALSLAGWIFQSLYAFTYNKFTPKVTSDLYNSAFITLLDHSHDFFINNFAGGLAKKVTRFSHVFQRIFQQLTSQLGQTILRLIIIFVILGFHNKFIVAGMLVWAMVYLIIQVKILKYKQALNKLRQKAETKVSGELSDAISHHHAVLLFNGSNFEKERFSKSNAELVSATVKAWMAGTSILRVQNFLMIALDFGVMYFLLSQWRKGLATIGDFVLVQSYLMQAFERLWNVGQNIQEIEQEISDANEMTEILLKEPGVIDIPNAKALKVKEGAIEFKEVSFGYESKDFSDEVITNKKEQEKAGLDTTLNKLKNLSSSVIPDKSEALRRRDPESLLSTTVNKNTTTQQERKDPVSGHGMTSTKVGSHSQYSSSFVDSSNTTNPSIPHHILSSFSLSILPKEKIALVGPSGGGKSTLTKLLFRFYDVNQGKILIDKQDISKVTQESLRKAMSLVPQEPVLFHRSIFENISYGKVNATEEEVIAASKLAHCHEFIEKLENKYQTLVGERGVKLSGGERQRVAIARAILKNAPILVLDEATSSLDSESESLIQDALKSLMKDKTVIVIAHRLSTIMQMDRIVVIEAGPLTEQGRHEELIKTKQGTYQRLWEIQAGGFA